MSLVAREVRGAALDQFMTTLTPEDNAILDRRRTLIDRLKARDLPVDLVLPKDEADAVLAGMRQAAQQAESIEQGLTQAKTASESAKADKLGVDAQIAGASVEAANQESLSRAEANRAVAKSTTDKSRLENLKTILEHAGDEKQGGGGQTGKPAAKGGASRSRKARG
jgi:hypothetical protein